MKVFVHTYPYFTASLFLLALFAVAYWRFRSQRHHLLVGGLLSAPSGFCAILFVPEYWDPVQLFRFGAGPEDLIFSFSNGGLIWLVVVAIHSGRSLEPRIEPCFLLRRWVVLTLGFSILWIPLLAVGLDVMRSSILAALLVLAALIRQRPELLPIASAGAALFGIPYTLLCGLLFRLFPGFLEQWSHANLSGWFVLGVPLEETAWALAWGATWPVVLAYVLDVRIGESTEYELGRAAAREAGAV